MASLRSNLESQWIKEAFKIKDNWKSINNQQHKIKILKTIIYLMSQTSRYYLWQERTNLLILQYNRRIWKTDWWISNLNLMILQIFLTRYVFINNKILGAWCRKSNNNQGNNNSVHKFDNCNSKWDQLYNFPSQSIQ